MEKHELRYYDSMNINGKVYVNVLIQFIEDEYNYRDLLIVNIY